MSKIERRPTPLATPAQPVQDCTNPVKPAPAAPVPGDRLQVSSAAKTAERLRATSAAIEAVLADSPRTTRQATAWLEKAQALHDAGTPSLKNGDLKALPLKERQQYTINLRRLDHLLEDGPNILRFFKGE